MQNENIYFIDEAQMKKFEEAIAAVNGVPVLLVTSEKVANVIETAMETLEELRKNAVNPHLLCKP